MVRSRYSYFFGWFLLALCHNEDLLFLCGGFYEMIDGGFKGDKIDSQDILVISPTQLSRY